MSTRKPVHVAASIPPIEAFRYVEHSSGKKTTKHSGKTISVFQMARASLSRNKRRSAFIVVSLMLCVLLLNCVGTAASSLDVEKQVKEMIRTDFVVLNAQSMNNQGGFTTRGMAVREQTIADISAQAGVVNGTAVYKNTLEESSIERMDIQEGETDPHALYQDMCSGKGVLLGVHSEMGSKTMTPAFDFLNVGDRITVYKNGEQIMELPVLAKAATNGDDEEIGLTTNGPFTVGGDGLFLYLPAGIYKELYDEPVIYKYSFDVEENQRENMTNFLNDYMETVDTSMNYMSADSARAIAEANQTMIRFVGGIVGIIFGLAGVLNLINMLITSILTRRHEFATMQSIGMTKRQLTQMLTLEGIGYAFGAALLGIALSFVLDMTLVRNILSGMWNYTFHLTLVPAILTSGILLIFSAIIPALALRQFNRGSIVEQLHISE